MEKIKEFLKKPIYKKFKVWHLLTILIVFSATGDDAESKNVDLCRCLNEPGNTSWAKENRDACDNKISKTIGVSDWKRVNFSKDPVVNARWEEMVAGCGY